MSSSNEEAQRAKKVKQDINQASSKSQGRRQTASRKNANDQVINDLSSFINEFTYLSNRPSKYSEQEVPIKEHSYQVYSANTTDNDAYNSNKLSNSATDENRNDLKVVSHRKKSVEWKDKRKKSPEHRRKQYISDSSDRDSTKSLHTSVEEQTWPLSSKKKKIPRSEKVERHPKVFRSRDRKNAISRSRSKSRKYKIVQRSKSRSLPKVERSQSDHKRYKIMPMRSSRRRSKSLVKYWPLTYGKKKIRGRQVIIKKRDHKAVKRPEVKELVPSESQPIIMLHPKNDQQKREVVHFQNDPEFLADPSLPCKCFKCMKKYKSLMQLSLEPLRIGDVYPKIELGPCAHYFNKDKCQQTVKNCARNCYYVGDIGVEVSDKLCNDACFAPPECTAEAKHQKSVHFKFNSLNHYIDSSITQYFHSILNETIYC